MTDDAGAVYDFLEPHELVSGETLRQLAAPIVVARREQLNRLASPDAGSLVPVLDPATAEYLAELSGYADGPEDGELGIDREVAALAARRAALAGYLSGRLLLGTLERSMMWSSPDAADIFDVVDQMDTMMIELPVSWGAESSELIDALASAVMPEPSLALVSVIAMSYDSGLAAALVEHDAVEGREPD